MSRMPGVDVATFDRMVREARLRFLEWDNRQLSNALTALSEQPRRFDAVERIALLKTAASRLWDAD